MKTALLRLILQVYYSLWIDRAMIMLLIWLSLIGEALLESELI